MAKSKALELARAAYRGFAEGDMRPLFSILDENIVWTNHSTSSYSPFAGIHVGVSGVKAYFSNMPEINQERFDIKAMAEANGYVMATIDRKAYYKAAGKLHEGQIVHVLQFQGEKLVRMDIYEHGHF